MSATAESSRFTDELLLGIAHCPNVRRCLEQPGSSHPCAKVVGAQARFEGEHVLPEPWSGDLETAPILFVSSNPSIAGGELAPRIGWSDEEIVDFYRLRFGGGSREWIKDGVRNLRQDGTYRKHAVRFWASVKGRAGGSYRASSRPQTKRSTGMLGAASVAPDAGGHSNRLGRVAGTTRHRMRP